MSKLVAVFSYSGVTKAAAEKIAADNGAEFFEIIPSVPYTAADVDWMDKTSRNVKEQNDPASRPAIVSLPDVSGVDELWVGYPIWWYTCPRIIDTFFDDVAEKLDGTKVHLFATSGTTGIEKSLEDLKKSYPSVNFVDAKMA